MDDENENENEKAAAVEAPSPEETFTAMMEAAIAMNEMYKSYRRAGFRRYEALWLTGVMAKGVPMPDWMINKLQEGE